MDMKQALAIVEDVRREIDLPGFIEAMEYIDTHYEKALPDVQRAHRIVLAGCRRFFAQVDGVVA